MDIKEWKIHLVILELLGRNGKKKRPFGDKPPKGR